MTFKVTCDENGKFYVNDKPVDRKPCGLTKTKSGKWYYSKEANVRDRLNIALKNGDITKEELYGCRDHIDRKKLWEEVKVKKGISGKGSADHPIYLDPAASCSEAVERLSKEQQVNIDGPWYGSTICFTGQMFDKGGDKISRKEVRNIANKTGFVWLEGVTIGCVFLVTGEYKSLTNKTKRAMELGSGILSPDEFWDLVDQNKID